MKPWKEKISLFKKNGCLGVISSPIDYRIPGISVYGAPKNFPLPLGYMHREVHDYILSSGGVANFTFLNWDPNPWEPINSGPFYTAFCVFLPLLFSINLIFASYRIGIWIYTEEKFPLTVGFICLCLEWICNALRFIQTILNPNRNKFGLPGANVINSIPICFSLICLVIIVFFWLDLTADPFYHGKLLGVMKIPAIIFIVIIILFEISTDVVRAVFPIYSFGADVQILTYLIFHSLLVIFCFCASYRILQNAKRSKLQKKKLFRVTYFIIGSGVLNICSTIVFCFVLSDYFLYNIYGNISIWFFLYLFFFGQSLLLIFIFKAPKHITSTATSDSAKQNSTSTP